MLCFCFTFCTVLQIEIGTAPDPNAIIGNILQTLAPREKTALYLKSQRQTPFRKDYGKSFSLMKLIIKHILDRKKFSDSELLNKINFY